MSPKSRKPRGGKNRAKRPPTPAGPKQSDVTIVAIGASAGGIEAVTELISHLQPHTGMAFVLIQHLDPKHHSILTELLARKTSMTVREVTDSMRVAPNVVYVIPPNASMSIAGDALQLGPREATHGMHMPIDTFMRALAQQKRNRAVGVILSGTGSDGTLGMAEIQAQGGVTLAQDESSAKYSAMPRSAVVAGYVDYVLPPIEIAGELARIAAHPYVSHELHSEPAESSEHRGSELSAIFQLLRASSGVDFTHYRQTTILRRIRRRMVVHKIDELRQYVRFLPDNPAEIKALYQDILISVTSFFRDPGVFEVLQSSVFPAIVKARDRQQAIRIWTPGCASGEETYSVAIALLEFLGDSASQMPIQLFGTDVSELSIVRARSGVYPKNISSDLSPARLRRFFTEVEGGYRVSRNLRDLCIFAQHNVLKDPPFSQMDLICCRNVLIYVEPVLQFKVLSLFHYALRPHGFLVLGTSEGLGNSTNLFATEDRAHKIFSKKSTVSRQPGAFSMHSLTDPADRPPVRVPVKPSDPDWSYGEAQKEFDRRLLSQYSPATVFVNEDLEIVHTRGNVDRYLKLAPGRASLSLLKMAREGLVVELRNSINRAKKENAPVGKKNIQIRQQEGERGTSGGDEFLRFINFDVIPVTLGNRAETYFMIVFQESPSAPAKTLPTRAAQQPPETYVASQRITKLEQELASTKEYLQSVIETLEATNEELQSANEEILSSNEELQSINEEMETAKEELQSTNEELTTVNDELRSRNAEVTQINNDLTNLLSSTDIAVIMIGSDLTIRRFTPKAQKFLGLIPSDIGRPISNINPSIEIDRLQSMILQVMADFLPLERELTDRNGIHYQLKILPYRTIDNKIDGAVITIVDIAVHPKSASG